MAIAEGGATLRETVFFEGVGLHTGQLCRVAVHPVSEVSTPCAITIRKGNSVFPARWDYVVDTTRATVLGDGGVRVSTVEHLMAALWMTGVTHGVIELLQGEEIPILDGSAQPFVEALRAALTPLPPLPTSAEEPRAALTPLPPLPTGWERGNPQLPSPACGRGAGGEGALVQARHADRYLGLSFGGDALFGYIDFPAPLGVQAGAFALSDALQQIAPARTFGFLREVEALRQQGLALGGALENALVIDETGYHNPARFEDEPLRHKLLDVLGDLYLCGVRLTGFTLVAVKPGHALNVQLARQIAQAWFTED
ncbi:MAG: UDP-3-O-acyl-N-acetylglucosamine deacetylase [Fimbriimonadales bacterium]|nr:MAG: UDP-3-O-acyl-N-acetylglucosamine deacetylase [Fimbriimonadales bacterium]